MNQKQLKKHLSRIAGFAIAMVLLLGSLANAKPLEITTQTRVNDQGRVAITLNLKNAGSSPLHHIHPMLHFHHTMAMLPAIHSLGPGETITLENKEHPPVRMPGSYPIVAMVNYHLSEAASSAVSMVHTSSFYFKEAMPSQIEGSIVATGGDEESLLKVVLKNGSESFKNIRLMLVLPPEIQSDIFKGMMGFTLRAGEEKTFDIPVHKIGDIPGGQFPVHLLVEYGQMVKHYSGDIAGTVNFDSFWGPGPIWPHFLVVLFLSYTLYGFIRSQKTAGLQKSIAIS